MNCFECNEGVYVPIIENFETPIGDRRSGKVFGRIFVPNIEILTCNKCGDRCIDSENSRMIDEAVLQTRKNINTQ